MGKFLGRRHSRRHPRSFNPRSRRRLAFEALEDRRLLASTRIQVDAAGATGSEAMRLLIDGAPVATWVRVLGNPSAGVYETFTYHHPVDVAIDQIRVEFLNDANGPTTGDRNLFVDSVTINNLRYDTRSSNVYSTGTWLPGIGVTPGYNKQSPALHTNGYFDYGDFGSTIDVLAAGSTGGERIALQIDGVTVAQYDVTGGNYAQGSSYQRFTYQHSTPVAENQIRVAFINDGTSASGQDKNVRIDGVVLDGRKLESERLGVLTTGTPHPTQGSIPRLLQTEKLFTNGYFQYGDNGAELFINAAGSLGDETMRLLINGQTAATYRFVQGDAATGQFRMFRYRHDVGLPLNQVSITLVNDNDPAYDRNLRVDHVRLNGVTTETESAFVYSTGTFVPGVGVAPGYWRSEYLHVNGAFQYAQPGNPGTLALETSLISVDEDAGSVSIPVVRTGGSDGTVGVEYTTVDASAAAGSDYSARSGMLVFAPGETRKTIVVPILDDGDDELNETFNLATSVVVGSAVLGQPRTATITIVDDDGPPPPGSGNGLLGAYYNGQYHQSLVFERTDPAVDFDWVLGSPGPGVNADYFSVRWVGQVEARFTETYTFYTSTDDGVNLWVNGQLLVGQYRDQALTTHQGSIALVEGQKYDIMMEYYDATGYAISRLEWASPSTPRQAIPTSQLYSDPPTVTVPGYFTAQTAITGLATPTSMDFDASGRMFIAEQAGRVRVVQSGQLLAAPFLDIANQVNYIQDRGLIGVAVHPDFPATPYVYVSYVWDPPETANFSGNAGRDGAGNRLSRVSRFTADAAQGYNRAVPGSEVVLVGGGGTWATISHPELDSTFNTGIPATGGPDGSAKDVLIIDTRTHAIGNLAFGPEGALYVANGDGASYGLVDPRAVRVQNIDSLSGKILRVDPITGNAWPGNPFHNGDATANRSKVINYGLRNPFRFAIQPGTGTLVVGDVGWNTHEEINLGWGENFGWPYYEGLQGANAQTGGYNTLAGAGAFYANNNAVPPIWSRAHAAGGVAVVAGDFYTGTRYPAQYQDALFFSDFGDTQLKYMQFNADGSYKSVNALSLSAGPVVEMSMGRDGYLYYVDITGKIGRLIFNDSAPALAAITTEGATIAGDFNGDGRVNGGDFLFWQRNLASGDPALANSSLDAWESGFGLGAPSAAGVGWLALAADAAAPTPAAAVLGDSLQEFVGTNSLQTVFELHTAAPDRVSGDLDLRDFAETDSAFELFDDDDQADALSSGFETL